MDVLKLGWERVNTIFTLIIHKENIKTNYYILGSEKIEFENYWD